MSQTEQMIELAPTQRPQNFTSQQMKLLAGASSHHNHDGSSSSVVAAHSSSTASSRQILPQANWPMTTHQYQHHPQKQEDQPEDPTISAVVVQKNHHKRKRSSQSSSVSSSNNRRVSFSDAQSVVVQVQGPSVDDKRNSWYGQEDYYEFMFRAHSDAQALKSAAQTAASPESLFHFIQSNPDLCPRGLEKVLAYCDGDDEEVEAEFQQQQQQRRQQQRVPSPPTVVVESRDRRRKKQKVIHRQVILSMHRFQKETGEQNPEEIRKFSEDSSKWAVETALKLGHIDAAGLI